MHKLHILIDTSTSMEQRVVPGRSKRKIDLVRNKLTEALQTTIFDQLFLYTFTTELNEIGKFNTVKQALHYKFPTGGGTIIWDNIVKVLNKINNKDEALIICITDGEDGGSQCNYNSLIDQISDSKVILKIIDLGGKLYARH